MKTRSPARIVELCLYILIVAAAVIWLLTGGKLYDPPEIAPRGRVPQAMSGGIFMPDCAAYGPRGRD
ncbi:MAG: hypothetical protein LBK56_07010 [Gracilibacteraceae bacterium]|nr:hypothetical protein [Gracilibacteraceae bacterium]